MSANLPHNNRNRDAKQMSRFGKRVDPPTSAGVQMLRFTADVPQTKARPPFLITSARHRGRGFRPQLRCPAPRRWMCVAVPDPVVSGGVRDPPPSSPPWGMRPPRQRGGGGRAGAQAWHPLRPSRPLWRAPSTSSQSSEGPQGRAAGAGSGGDAQRCIGRGGGYPRPPPPLQGAQPMPSHCPPDAKCQPQWHL